MPGVELPRGFSPPMGECVAGRARQASKYDNGKRLHGLSSFSLGCAVFKPLTQRDGVELGVEAFSSLRFGGRKDDIVCPVPPPRRSGGVAGDIVVLEGMRVGDVAHRATIYPRSRRPFQWNSLIRPVDGKKNKNQNRDGKSVPDGSLPSF